MIQHLLNTLDIETQTLKFTIAGNYSAGIL